MSEEEEAFKPEPADMGWLLTFADLISLLITFFVLLYSMKVVDTSQWDALKGTFEGVFSITKPIFKVKPDSSSSIEKINSFEADNLDYISNIINTRFSHNDVLKEATINRNRELDTLTITMPSRALFDVGSTDLKEGGVEAIGVIGDLLRHLDNRIEVGGHTDPAPITTDTIPTNWELAMLRAISVADTMKSQGIESPIAAVSYGSGQFYRVAPNEEKEERYRLARRVEIIIHGDQDQNRLDNQ